MKTRFVNFGLAAALVFPFSLLATAQKARSSQPGAASETVKTAPAQTGPSGIITTVAGTGFLGDSGNGGPAIDADLDFPTAIAVDGTGNFYFPDLYMGVIRKVAASTGKISIYAGTFGESGYAGDNGPATAAKLDQPQGVALDSSGNLYIADTRNNVIREVVAKTGVIRTVVGNGSGAWQGHGGSCGVTVSGASATETPLCAPLAVAVDSKGDIYIAGENYYVYKVTASSDTIGVVAGNGGNGYKGDGGLAVNAEMNSVYGLAIDSTGNLYISDTFNYAIRKVDALTGIITSLVGKPDAYGGWHLQSVRNWRTGGGCND